jgi:hypothetical protein
LRQLPHGFPIQLVGADLGQDERDEHGKPPARWPVTLTG